MVDALPDGAQALNFLRTYDYDVAVLDWRMPKMSGLDLVRELRRLGSSVPILCSPPGIPLTTVSPVSMRVLTIIW